MLLIRRLDNYNFTLGRELDEPKVVTIKNKEIVYKYKNENKYYGNLHGAIRGYIIHNNLDKNIKVPEIFKTIKPTSDSIKYSAFLESRDVLKQANLT